MFHLSNVSSPVLPQDLHSHFDTACRTLPPSDKIVDSQLSGQGVGYSFPCTPTVLFNSLSVITFENTGIVSIIKLHDGRGRVCFLTINPGQCIAHCSLREFSLFSVESIESLIKQAFIICLL